MAGLLFGLLFGSAVISGGADQQTRRANRGFAEARYKETGDPIQPIGLYYYHMPTHTKVVPEKRSDGRTVWVGVDRAFSYDPTQEQIDKEVAEICKDKILLAKEHGKRYIKLHISAPCCKRMCARRKYIDKEKHSKDFEMLSHWIDDYDYTDRYGIEQNELEDIILDLNTGEMYSQFLSKYDDYERFFSDSYHMKENIVKSEELLNSHYRINMIADAYKKISNWECLYLEEEIFNNEEEKEAFWDCINGDEEPIKFPSLFPFDIFSITQIRELVFGLSHKEAMNKYIRGFNQA